MRHMGSMRWCHSIPSICALGQTSCEPEMPVIHTRAACSCLRRIALQHRGDQWALFRILVRLFCCLTQPHHWPWPWSMATYQAHTPHATLQDARNATTEKNTERTSRQKSTRQEGVATAHVVWQTCSENSAHKASHFTSCVSVPCHQQHIPAPGFCMIRIFCAACS